MEIQRVRVREQITAIPTYEPGEPDKNPMFLEKRVYQGSSGRVYPYPVIDKIDDKKTLKNYRIVILENEYVRIEIMPELGGRIYRALDKTNNYDFVYYNKVIKPALVGLAGPWVSGGIEFNWPQHHRPNTYGPVEYRFAQNDDGSATVWVSEIDRMYGTKATAGFTLYPGKAYLEISVQLYNRTPEPQTFLWWANPAVAVNDHTQSVFPPDVTAVFDHGKRDVSKFPIATGTYYKMDYSHGVDISRYKNIPVPTSYMAYKSDYDFIGGYDHQIQAGLLHIANHYVSPGKKQWTWGNGEFGQAWDRNLTDEDGPYIELMTGVYTDNQPDFSWLQPYEEKSFKQYFMPYKNIGVIKNASIDAAVNLEIDERSREAVVMVYATSIFKGAVVELKGLKGIYLREEVELSPELTYKSTIPMNQEDQPHDLIVTVRNADGKILVSYRPDETSISEVPDAAKPLPEPEELKTNEQLYLAGLHLEQYRHATFEPDMYYLEGLTRDPADIRINVAYGTLLLRRGLFKEAEGHFRSAVKSLTWRNPNPYDSEAYYQLGLSLKFQGRLDEAFAAFYKAVWSAAWQDSGYFALAQISCERKQYAEALDLVDRSLVRNGHHFNARHLKAALLRKLGRFNEALNLTRETLNLDIADFGAYNESYLTLLAQGEAEKAEEVLKELVLCMRGNAHNYIHLASDYAACGLFDETIEVLNRIVKDHRSNAYPMLHYALGYAYKKNGRTDQALLYLKGGNAASPDYCFPNSLFEYIVLENAVIERPEDDKAHYYLGNWLYDKKRYDEAIHHWESSRSLQGNFSTIHRNLALAYYNKRKDMQAALASMETAFDCQPNDARVLFELDQLYKKMGYEPETRLAKLEKHQPLVFKRDDLYLEYVSLLNVLGRYIQAAEALAGRTFHPWEGGEGKVTGQYVITRVEMAKCALKNNEFEEAARLLNEALVYPENLGEGKLFGAQENHIYYYLGTTYLNLKKEKEALECFSNASLGLAEPANAMYYNDQPPEMIFYQGLAWLKLNNEKEAKRRFNRLIAYAEKHLFDDVRMDYFAVSLPEFLLFDDDLNKRNAIHCYFMMGLGLLGLGHPAQARVKFDKVLQMDPNHQGARIHRKMCEDGIL
ncbi:DUF5107 domain-containing protein [Paenibacillus azoreducens]|uniref:tetratricopeptide repeat protein n=1 Tax=Paenibacillus azoreducens TaxID=116718 RepID=UPI0039F54364